MPTFLPSIATPVPSSLSSRSVERKMIFFVLVWKILNWFKEKFWFLMKQTRKLEQSSKKQTSKLFCNFLDEFASGFHHINLLCFVYGKCENTCLFWSVTSCGGGDKGRFFGVSLIILLDNFRPSVCDSKSDGIGYLRVVFWFLCLLLS